MFTGADDGNKQSVSIEWKPFQLDASFPDKAEPMDEYIQKRFGPRGAQMLDNIRSAGVPDGAMFANTKWRCNTMKALQLVDYARDRGIESSITKAALFEAMYEKGQDVSDIGVLTRIAQSIGLLHSDNDSTSDSDKEKSITEEQAELRHFLTNNVGKARVEKDIQDGRQKYDISGVPFFVVQGSDNSQRPIAFSGAQPTETFLEVFEELN